MIKLYFIRDNYVLSFKIHIIIKKREFKFHSTHNAKNGERKGKTR